MKESSFDQPLWSLDGAGTSSEESVLDFVVFGDPFGAWNNDKRNFAATVAKS